MAPPEHPDTPAVPPAAENVPETDASRAMRAAGAEVVGALQRYHAAFAGGAVRLTEDERASGQGKLRDGEASVLAQVAQLAVDHPALLAGLAAKDGGTDPHAFEAEALRGHLALHVAARDVSRDIAAQARHLHTLVSDQSIYHGAQARGPILAAYKILAAVAEHDPTLALALAPVREFFDRPARPAST